MIKIIFLTTVCAASCACGEGTPRTTHETAMASPSAQLRPVAARSDSLHASAAFIGAATEEPRVQASPTLVSDWNTYFGRHYVWKPWAASLRDPGAGEQPGRPATTAGSDAVGRVTTALRAAPAASNVVVMVTTFPRAGMMSQRMRNISADRGASARNRVAEQVSRELDAAAPGSTLRFQIGNEINTRTTSRIVRNATRAGGTAHDDDMQIIPVYVEYLLAPCVQAIDSVSRARFGQPGRISIVLGSLAGARRESARRWLDALLSYQVQGANAPALAGRRVADLVNIVAVHYIVTDPSGPWERNLESVRTRWVGQGRVTAVWSTEEVGRQAGDDNMGAATALRVASRYMHYWAQHALSAEQGHAFFWGADIGNPGTTADDFMEPLWSFLGPVRLEDVSASIGGHPGGEAYAFRSTQQPTKVAVMLMTRGAFRSLDGGDLTLNFASSATTARVYLFSRSGTSERSASVSTSGSRTTIEVPASADASAALVLLGG